MSHAEETLKLHMHAERLPVPEREYRFHPTRRWRFDFAWPDIKLAVEVEGVTHYGKNRNGTMKLGRHQTSAGLNADCEKYGEAMLLGWDVYRCTQQMVKSGQAIETIKKLLKLKGVKISSESRARARVSGNTQQDLVGYHYDG